VSVSDAMAGDRSGRLIRRLAGHAGRGFAVSQPAADAKTVEVCVFRHAYVSMITYHVDVYRSRPIGTSLQSAWP